MHRFPVLWVSLVFLLLILGKVLVIGNVLLLVRVIDVGPHAGHSIGG